ncbi:hypothetical protein [Sphingobium sp.]|uniref:hypothetical protein n=1 Tax=Sphingobium sp. TaxID=1912891 RepID=UPI0035C6A879
MTKTVSRANRRRHAAIGQQIHIPHSSWTRTDRASEQAAPVKPDEFWIRLGL